MSGQRMSDAELAKIVAIAEVTEPDAFSNDLLQGLLAERAIVDEVKELFKFFAPVLRAEGLPKVADELHTILYPPQEPKE